MTNFELREGSMVRKLEGLTVRRLEKFSKWLLVVFAIDLSSSEPGQFIVRFTSICFISILYFNSASHQDD